MELVCPVAGSMDFIEFFKSNCKHRSPDYRSALKWVMKYQKGEPLTISDVTEDWGIGFRRYLVVSLSYNTAANYLVRLKSILKIALKSLDIAYNPLEDVKLNARRLPSEQLSPEQITLLYSKLKIYKKNKRVILKAFLLGLETGLRISDILSLDESSVKNGYVSLCQRKTGKYVQNKLTDRAIELLSDGLPKVKMTKGGIYWHIKNVLEENNIAFKHKKFHLARHTFANIHVEIGTPLPVLQQLMGHSNISSTMHYVNPTQESKDKAMKRFGGR